MVNIDITLTSSNLEQKIGEIRTKLEALDDDMSDLSFDADFDDIGDSIEDLSESLEGLDLDFDKIAKQIEDASEKIPEEMTHVIKSEDSPDGTTGDGDSVGDDPPDSKKSLGDKVENVLSGDSDDAKSLGDKIEDALNKDGKRRRSISDIVDLDKSGFTETPTVGEEKEHAFGFKESALNGVISDVTKDTNFNKQRPGFDTDPFTTAAEEAASFERTRVRDPDGDIPNERLTARMDTLNKRLRQGHGIKGFSPQNFTKSFKESIRGKKGGFPSRRKPDFNISDFARKIESHFGFEKGSVNVSQGVDVEKLRNVYRNMDGVTSVSDIFENQDLKKQSVQVDRDGRVMNLARAVKENLGSYDATVTEDSDRTDSFSKSREEIEFGKFKRRAISDEKERESRRPLAKAVRKMDSIDDSIEDMKSQMIQQWREGLHLKDTDLLDDEEVPDFARQRQFRQGLELGEQSELLRGVGEQQDLPDFDQIYDSELESNIGESERIADTLDDIESHQRELLSKDSLDPEKVDRSKFDFDNLDDRDKRDILDSADVEEPIPSFDELQSNEQRRVTEVGFDKIDEKQRKGILESADINVNPSISFDELDQEQQNRVKEKVDFDSVNRETQKDILDSADISQSFSEFDSVEQDRIREEAISEDGRRFSSFTPEEQFEIKEVSNINFDSLDTQRQREILERANVQQKTRFENLSDDQQRRVTGVGFDRFDEQQQKDVLERADVDVDPSISFDDLDREQQNRVRDSANINFDSVDAERQRQILDSVGVEDAGFSFDELRSDQQRRVTGVRFDRFDEQQQKDVLDRAEVDVDPSISFDDLDREQQNRVRDNANINFDSIDREKQRQILDSAGVEDLGFSFDELRSDQQRRIAGVGFEQFSDLQQQEVLKKAGIDKSVTAGSDASEQVGFNVENRRSTKGSDGFSFSKPLKFSEARTEVDMDKVYDWHSSSGKSGRSSPAGIKKAKKFFSGFGSSIKRVVPNMSQLYNIVAALIPLIIVLGAQMAGVATAMAAVAVAGASIIGLGLLGHGDSMAESFSNAKKEVSDLAEALFEVSQPTMQKFAPIQSRAFDAIPGRVQDIAEAMEGLVVYEDTLFQLGGMLSEGMVGAVKAIVANEEAISQLALRFSKVIGSGILDFFSWLFEMGFKNQEMLLTLGDALKDLATVIFRVLEVLVLIIGSVSWFTDILLLLSQALQVDVIRKLVVFIGVAYLTASALSKMGIAALYAFKAMGMIASGQFLTKIIGGLAAVYGHVGALIAQYTALTGAALTAAAALATTGIGGLALIAGGVAASQVGGNFDPPDTPGSSGGMGSSGTLGAGGGTTNTVVNDNREFNFISNGSEEDYGEQKRFDNKRNTSIQDEEAETPVNEDGSVINL